MFRVIIALALALPLVAQADPGRQHGTKAAALHDDARADHRGKSRRSRSIAVDERRLRKRVKAINHELDRLEALLAHAPNQPRAGRKGKRRHREAQHTQAVAAQFAEVRARLKSLKRVVDDAPKVPRRPKVRRQPVGPQAMSVSQFTSFQRSVGDARYNSDKQDVVRRAIRHNHFTSDQARMIALQFRYASDRLTVLTALHPRVVDPENFEQAYGVLRYTSDRRKLDQAIHANTGR